MKPPLPLLLLVVIPLTPFGPTASFGVAGDLDTTFNATGKVTIDIDIWDNDGRSVAVQADGKILVAGYCNCLATLTRDFALVRFNQNGTLDTALSDDGKVTTDLTGLDDYAYCVTVQPDGKIVLAGSSGGGSDFALVRYNANGILDTTLNTTGKVTTDISGNSDCAEGLALQTDGKLILAGYAQTGSNIDFAVARYNTNGALDTTFNGTGKVTTPIGTADDYGRCVALQPDGKILVAGESSSDFALVRYNANGTLDTTFNGTGKVTTAFGSYWEYAYGVAVQEDGKIVVVGHSYPYSGASYDFAVARYNTNGTLDTTFNGTGKVTTGIGARDDYGRCVALQPDGKILVAGYSASDTTSYDFVLVRYNTSGTLDTTFNGSGKVTTPLSSMADCCYSATIDATGRILLAGYGDRAGDSDSYHAFALVRYLGSEDPEIAVEHPATTNLVDGSCTVTFEPTLTQENSTHLFTIRNKGGGALVGLSMVFDGPNATDFSVSAYPSPPVVGPTGSTTFALTFAPSSPGPKTAALRIESNDTDENPFDINLTGRALAPDADDDSDLITNETEIRLATLVFDPLNDSSNLRTLLQNNALGGLGLYRASDMHNLALGHPLLERDPTTGDFFLTIGVQKSPDLSAWSPLTGYSPTYDPITGEISIEITPGATDAQFYRVLGNEP